MYRVGFPFWKALVRRGVPVTFRVDVYRDAESKTFWAKSPHLDGLVVSGATLDELREEVRSAAEALLDFSVSKHAPVTPVYRLRDEAICAA